MITPGDLHKVWAAPDNTRLTSKQFSFRLPVHVAAKISAICDMFPEKTRTQIVADLLATALEDFEQSFPYVQGELIGNHPDTGEPIHEDLGPQIEYRKRADHYYRELELEMGNENPRSLFDRAPVPKASDE